MCCLRRDQKTADAVIGENLGAGWKPSIRIENDARRLRTGDPPHRQLRVIGESGADANDDGVDQGAQPMQMRESRRSVDVFRVSGFGGDAPVQRLPDLANDDQIIDCPDPERPEQFVPWRRQGPGSMF